MTTRSKSKTALTILPLIAASIFLSACSDNIDNRQDRRDDRQDCRSDEGIVGGDKRDCKQDERAADSM